MSLLQMSVTGGVMILAITVLRALAMNHVPKKTFLALWGAALLRLVLPVSLSSTLSIYSLLGQKTALNVVDVPAAATPALLPGQAVTALPQIDAAPVQTISVWSIVWIAGVVLCAAFFAAVYWKCCREFRMSFPVDNDASRQWLQTHPLRRGICIRQSDQISSPLTFGVLHPVILMPKKTDWNDETALQYVLEHEFVHIRRFDTVSKLLLIAAACVHWFNPLVWVMYVLANRDMELSCDESVVRRFGSDARASYANILISMEETRSGFAPLCNHFSRNAIEERITAIMKTRKTTVVSLVLAAVIVAGTTTVFATSALAESKGSMDTNYYETETSGGLLISYTDDNGDMYYVYEDENTTWTMSAEEFERQHPSPVIEWWTYDEYKKWLDNEKETLQSMIGEKSWTSQGEFVWTQEMVDETIAEYEKMLQDIKDGMMYSKTVDGETDIMVGYDPKYVSSSGGYELFVTLENGEEKLFGPYETHSELHAAVESFCNAQVKLGNMDQSEAREIVSQCVQN